MANNSEEFKITNRIVNFSENIILNICEKICSVCDIFRGNEILWLQEFYILNKVHDFSVFKEKNIKQCTAVLRYHFHFAQIRFIEQKSLKNALFRLMVSVIFKIRFLFSTPTLWLSMDSKKTQFLNHDHPWKVESMLESTWHCMFLSHIWSVH